MSRKSMTRRQALGGAIGIAAGVIGTHGPAARGAEKVVKNTMPFVYCLNTSTIRGQKLQLSTVIDLAIKAGFTAIEPWVGDVDGYAKGGGDLKEIRKRLVDGGMTVVDTIGFAPWLMGDEEANKKGVESMKRDMDLVAQIGALRIAAPPMGATALSGFDLNLAAERYRKILELGEQTGVSPLLEVWGHSKTLGTLAEGLFVAAAAKHPRAAVLTDVYHLYKGGSGYEGLALVDGTALPVMHFNDYPAQPPREKIKDENRLFPGDGIAPLTTVLKTLAAKGTTTALSLELFNKEYWKMEAGEVLKIGLAKMKAVVERAMG